MHHERPVVKILPSVWFQTHIEILGCKNQLTFPACFYDTLSHRLLLTHQQKHTASSTPTLSTLESVMKMHVLFI